MRYYKNIQSLIGGTPLVELTRIGLPSTAQLFAKLEYFNPAGSVKDRTALKMLIAAERSGKLIPGSTIVEATAGNTGLGIALAALGRSYRIIFVVPEKFSEEKQILMRALGAEIINTPWSEGMLGASRKAEEIRSRIAGSIGLNQFTNPANPLCHYETTGPEIYSDLDGEIDFFVAGAGSGGTFSGVAKYLKESSSRIQTVLADPQGSTMGGGEHHDYDIEGIGNDFIPQTMDMNLVDKVLKVSDKEAIEASRLLARYEGIIAGSSSGAAVAATRKLIQQGAEGNIVVILPDRGDRYFSKKLYG